MSLQQVAEAIQGLQLNNRDPRYWQNVVDLPIDVEYRIRAQVVYDHIRTKWPEARQLTLNAANLTQVSNHLRPLIRTYFGEKPEHTNIALTRYTAWAFFLNRHKNTVSMMLPLPRAQLPPGNAQAQPPEQHQRSVIMIVNDQIPDTDENEVDHLSAATQPAADMHAVNTGIVHNDSEYEIEVAGSVFTVRPSQHDLRQELDSETLRFNAVSRKMEEYRTAHQRVADLILAFAIRDTPPTDEVVLHHVLQSDAFDAIFKALAAENDVRSQRIRRLSDMIRNQEERNREDTDRRNVNDGVIQNTTEDPTGS